jgi:hypothetical protein
MEDSTWEDAPTLVTVWGIVEVTEAVEAATPTLPSESSASKRTTARPPAADASGRTDESVPVSDAARNMPGSTALPPRLPCASATRLQGTCPLGAGNKFRG